MAGRPRGRALVAALIAATGVPGMAQLGAPRLSGNTVRAGYVLGTGVRWQDSPLFSSRHQPGLDLLRAGAFSQAAGWFAARARQSPEDLFYSRGLYEACALGASTSDIRAATISRIETAVKEKQRVGPVELLLGTALLSLGARPIQGKDTVFSRLDAYQLDEGVLAGLSAAAPSLAMDRSATLWCAVAWRDLGYSGPARDVLRKYLNRDPADIAVRYTLARFYSTGEASKDASWSKSDPLRANGEPRPADALRESETILERSPDFYPALWIAGTSALDEGDRSKARRYLERYVAIGKGKDVESAQRLLKSL